MVGNHSVATVGGWLVQWRNIEALGSWGDFGIDVKKNTFVAAEEPLTGQCAAKAKTNGAAILKVVSFQDRDVMVGWLMVLPACVCTLLSHCTPVLESWTVGD